MKSALWAFFVPQGVHHFVHQI